MIRIAAFADEISPDPNEQAAVLRSEGIGWVELRAAWETNVLDLSDAQVRELERIFGENGVRVAAIGSPLGKVPVDTPPEERRRRFERAVELAQRFETRLIRIFSFYPPNGHEAIDSEYRAEVLERLSEMAEQARTAGLTLLHENDVGLYGDTIARCVEVMGQVDDPHLRAVLDPANFILCGQAPYPDGYEALRPWIAHVHVKDATAEGTVVPAGAGVGRWPELLQRLRQDGYDGFFSLEPHLQAGGPYGGFSGPDLFRAASQALQGLLRDMGWEYA